MLTFFFAEGPLEIKADPASHLKAKVFQATTKGEGRKEADVIDQMFSGHTLGLPERVSEPKVFIAVGGHKVKDASGSQ